MIGEICGEEGTSATLGILDQGEREALAQTFKARERGRESESTREKEREREKER